MSVCQEFYDVFIKIEDIDRVYPGGFDAYCQEFSDLIGEAIWHDEYLLREGAMSGADVEQIIDGWAARGLQPYRLEDGEPVEWIECCVSSRYGGHTVRDLVAAMENKPLDCRELVPSMKEQDRCQRMALW
jgi:hypothetical protein